MRVSTPQHCGRMSSRGIGERGVFKLVVSITGLNAVNCVLYPVPRSVNVCEDEKLITAGAVAVGVVGHDSLRCPEAGSVVLADQSTSVVTLKYIY